MLTIFKYYKKVKEKEMKIEKKEKRLLALRQKKMKLEQELKYQDLLITEYNELINIIENVL